MPQEHCSAHRCQVRVLRAPHCRRAAVHTAGGASVVARFTTCLRTCTPHSLSPYRTVPYQVYSTGISSVAAYGVEQCGLAPPHGSQFQAMALVLVCIVGARSLRLKLAWAISRPQPHKRASPLWVQLRVVPNLVNGLMTSVIASLIDLDWIPHERALWNSP